MSNSQPGNMFNEDDYDEDTDSDFTTDGANEDNDASSSDEATAADDADKIILNKDKISSAIVQGPDAIELDSGDEATIKERNKARKRQKKGEEIVDGGSDAEDRGWRTRTRAMREREKYEKKQNALVDMEKSTIDVEKAWEEMNRPGPLPPIRIDDSNPIPVPSAAIGESEVEQNKKNAVMSADEETVTIKRKFVFAGETHYEEKIVPKSSAEARLWLSQQETISQPAGERGKAVRRPLRKISKFDPNFNNLEAFKTDWVKKYAPRDSVRGPKLNVVEKSKIDWATHVDSAGLKDELDDHAKAKEGYHSRMDFLSQVGQRKEQEARQARMNR